jgi:hypothetical protein
LGWNIISGHNDKLDFTEGVTGAAVATITEGNYPTGDALADEIETQMNYEATDNTYTVTYESTGSDAYKFVITRATGSETIDLDWYDGPNASDTIGPDIGFAVTADDTGGTEYIADNESYKSREYVDLNIGTASGVKLSSVLGHNLTASSTVTLYGGASSPPTTYTSDLDGTGDLRMLFLDETYQYWRFLFDDIDNQDGYTEVGLCWLSSYDTVSRGVEEGYGDGRAELSTVAMSDQGTPFYDIKRTKKTWQVGFRQLTEADKTTLETMLDYTKNSRAIFFSLDPASYPITKTRYVTVNARPFQHAQVENWDVDLTLTEAEGS